MLCSGFLPVGSFKVPVLLLPGTIEHILIVIDSSFYYLLILVIVLTFRSHEILMRTIPYIFLSFEGKGIFCR